MHFIKLTNQITKQPIWINSYMIAQIDEIASGSRIILCGGNTGITRIVCESSEDILKIIDEVPSFNNFKITTTDVPLTPY